MIEMHACAWSVLYSTLFPHLNDAFFEPSSFSIEDEKF